MAWELSSWLVLTRSFQVMGALAAGGLNGYLVALIYSKHLGLTNAMITLELMAVVVLLYTILAMLIQHTGRRSKVTSWLVFFIVCDFGFVALSMAIVTLLAAGGVPSNCGGLTRPDFLPGDEPNHPAGGYTTVRFSDEGPGQKGELDKFCAFERSYYFIAIGLVFTYLLTITLSILRICEKNYTKNSRVSELLSALERAHERDQKLLMTPASSSPRARDGGDDDDDDKMLGFAHRHRANLAAFPASAPSEGIITRTASVRSAMTASTSSVHNTNPYRPSLTLSTGVVGASAAAPAAIPRRPVLPPRPVPMSMTGTGLGLGLGFVPSISTTAATPTGTPPTSVTLGPSSVGAAGGLLDDEDEEDDHCAEAALVSDGMRHYGSRDYYPQHQQQQQQHPYQHQHQHQHPQRMPMLAEEEHLAGLALVSDGMRSNEPVLPPYEPRRHSGSLGGGGGGSGEMAGHSAAESNEMRLSEYVKGQTRAQGMKDSGGF